MIAVTIPEQARENREYVRRLLKEKQPEFAAALELAEQELSESTRMRAVGLTEFGGPN
jgi:hypothetical protein